MANNQRLKQKSINANKSEFFVFLPNHLTDINAISSINAIAIYRHAIAAKNEGNKCFENDRYDDAILHYNRAIEILEEANEPKPYESALGVCYQNRATANAFKKNYVDAILDATKAIELNEHYSKAYYRRAMCYIDQKRYYRALQDIIQACVLERFRNQLYINTAVEIVAAIDKDPAPIQWKKAYVEMDADSLYCDLCLKQHMRFVKNCGVFDSISVPIPENSEIHSLTGYIRAMAGIEELNIPEIMAGCNEEISSKGNYLAHSYILKAYMNSVVIQSSTTLGYLQQDMQHMNDVISDPTVPETVKHQAKFCRANLYNRKGLFGEANRDLKSLEGQYGHTGLFHVIKSSALFQFALKNKSFFEPLVKCSEVLPNVYELHFQVVYAQSNYISDPLAATTLLMHSLENLIKRFPLELSPRMLLIGFYIELDVNKAIRLLRQTRKDFPNRLEEMIWLYGQLKPNHPSCVDYFKRAIRAHKDDPNSFESLLNYFDSTSYEYAKAIEVSNKALSNFLKEDDFKEMFERRQHLLKRIIRQNFWDKL